MCTITKAILSYPDKIHVVVQPGVLLRLAERDFALGITLERNAERCNGKPVDLSIRIDQAPAAGEYELALESVRCGLWSVSIPVAHNFGLTADVRAAELPLRFLSGGKEVGRATIAIPR